MANTQLATFANGCFWGTQHYFNKAFKNAIVSSQVGYTGGSTVNPTYRQVCNGDTGHAEALQIEFDPSKVQYAELVEYHFRMHDPTQLNRQMNDVGTQYRSAIFFHTPEQEKIAIEVRDRLQATKIKGKIVTQIAPASKFYVAEDYHQLYLEANPGGYCSHRLHW